MKHNIKLMIENVTVHGQNGVCKHSYYRSLFLGLHTLGDNPVTLYKISIIRKIFKELIFSIKDFLIEIISSYFSSILFLCYHLKSVLISYRFLSLVVILTLSVFFKNNAVTRCTKRNRNL